MLGPRQLVNDFRVVLLDGGAREHLLCAVRGECDIAWGERPSEPRKSRIKSVSHEKQRVLYKTKVTSIETKERINYVIKRMRKHNGVAVLNGLAAPHRTAPLTSRMDATTPRRQW